MSSRRWLLPPGRGIFSVKPALNFLTEDLPRLRGAFSATARASHRRASARVFLNEHGAPLHAASNRTVLECVQNSGDVLVRHSARVCPECHTLLGTQGQGQGHPSRWFQCHSVGSTCASLCLSAGGAGWLLSLDTKHPRQYWRRSRVQHVGDA